MQLQTALLIFAIGVCLCILCVSLLRLKTSGALSIATLATATTLWGFTLLSYQLKWLPVSAMVLISITYLCSAIAAISLLVFALIYTNRSNFLSNFMLLLLATQPALTQLLLWYKPMRDNLFLEPNSGIANLFQHTGVWPKFSEVYIYSLVIISLALLLDTFNKKPHKFRIQSGSILVAAFIPFFLQLVRLTDLTARFTSSWYVIGYSVTLAGFAYGVFRSKLIDFVPITRDAVVQGMEDGWVIIDNNNNIIDINPAGEKITGLTRNKAYGQSIKQALSDWRGLENTLGGVTEFEMRRSVRSENAWRYVNIRVSALLDQSQKSFGHLIVWHDITDTKLREDSRQRARDEMFVLLNAISSVASHALDLENFLAESVYQIIYPFESQAVLIFLMDENEKAIDGPALTLVSHLGIPYELTSAINNIRDPSSLFSLTAKNKTPFLIEDIKNDARVPKEMQNTDFSTLIILPLITRAEEEVENKVLGCLCLARKEKSVYTPDEINRLMIISEHIATLIDSDRRRQLAISLSERQRLLRDLHDSVSQKLYGLVALTEAAQATIEAGSTVSPAQILSRIGENARQAVKEMRLFLYEMQPVDLENEGLVSVLHHRLSAVEGRADIKARLLADENISLAKDKEIALYFIAQEGLNNVLRHAHAKSVTVTLKQKNQNVILEIHDDGRGFDTKNLDPGGMGLRNMKERAILVDAKLKIISKPGAGTKISVIVSKERTRINLKNRQSV